MRLLIHVGIKVRPCQWKGSQFSNKHMHHWATRTFAFHNKSTVKSFHLINITGHHYNDAAMSSMASQITSLTIVYSTVYSDADQRKHQSSASLAFVREIHRWPVNSPHKWPVTRKKFPFDDVIITMHSNISAWRGQAFHIIQHGFLTIDTKRTKKQQKGTLSVVVN